MKAKTTQGFTIVELLIAISVMGIMSALTTAVVISTIRFYAFTNNFRQNQQAGRNILDTITTDTRFGELAESGDNNLCVKFAGNKVILYQRDNSNNFTRTVFYNSNCSVPATSTSTLLNPASMKVTLFKSEKVNAPLPASGNSTSATIRLEFITGSSVGNACGTRDIYCAKSILNTATSLFKDL